MIHLNFICRIRAVRLGFFSFLLLGVIWGCAQPRAVQPDSSAHGAAGGVTMVLPFVDMEQVFGRNISVRSPVTSKVFVTETIDEKAALFMTNAIYRLVGQQTGLKWGAFQYGQHPNPVDPFGLRTNHIDQLRELGRRKGADTIMAGYLYAFKERTGSDYGVESPAHVAFELVLVQTSSGRILWQRSFEEVQKSLSEDLLQLKSFLKRKGRWVSAREMAKGALKEMLETVPIFDTGR
ncbi:MAG: hypothetical protein PVJ19_09900 [Desulfobacteraceae bacterium]